MSLIKCKDCGHEVSTDARACPYCGGKSSKSRRFWVGVALFIFILIIIGNLTDNSKDTKEQTITSAPELNVNAETLMSDYQANEVAADAQYKNRVIKVTGVVDSIGKDILDNPYITLKTGNTFSVQCTFDHSFEKMLANLVKDEELTMVGRVSGKFGNIILKECLF